VSVDLERDDKQGRAALGCGSAMFFVFAVAAVVLWIVPTTSGGHISGERLGLPFTGVGAIALAGAGLLIAAIGYLMLRAGRKDRAPDRPLPPRGRHVPLR
jgi:hypothetical protein